MNRKAFTALLAIVFLSVFSVTIRATDYILDTSFNPIFQFTDVYTSMIQDVAVQPDQKVLVAGQFSGMDGAASPMIIRLNPDGTRDATFNSPLVQHGGFISRVDTIRLLPGGKILITGTFKIGNDYSSYARLNADGSIDSSLSHYASVSARVEPLPDGRLLVCSSRADQPVMYDLIHRLNSDGSVDPTFRATYGRGVCLDLEVLPDGKVLIAGDFYDPANNNTPLPSVQRLNSDGTTDPTFHYAAPPISAVRKIALLPDGKFIAPNCCRSGAGVIPYIVTGFNPDGSVDKEYPNCGLDSEMAIVPRADGSVLMGGCRKWTTGSEFQFANIRPDGQFDGSLDRIDIDGSVREIKGDGQGNYYIVGRFTKVDDVPRIQLARLKPYVAPIKPKFDFDGDGRSDVSVYRPGDHFWYIDQSTAGFTYVNWGLPTDYLIAGNYDQDDRTDVAVFRNSVWYYLNNNGYGYHSLGELSARPVLGDFDGDGKQDFAARDPGADWQIRLNGQAIWLHDTVSIDGEQSRDKAVVGDFDGDRRDEIGYFRAGDWVIRDHGFSSSLRSVHWGAAGDIPVAADYDGDGTTDFAVFRPSTGTWWIDRSTDGAIGIQFGLNGDIPVPADYDGDGKTDIAIFRNGEWWQYRSNGPVVHFQQWGMAGDMPIPAQGQ